MIIPKLSQYVTKPKSYKIPNGVKCYYSPLTRELHSLNPGIHENIKEGEPIVFTNGSDNEIFAICPFYRSLWKECHSLEAKSIVPNSIYVKGINICRMIRSANDILTSSV